MPLIFPPELSTQYINKQNLYALSQCRTTASYKWLEFVCTHFLVLSAYYAIGNEFCCTTSVPIIGNEWWGAMEPYPYIARLYINTSFHCVFSMMVSCSWCIFALLGYVSNTYYIDVFHHRQTANIAPALLSPAMSQPSFQHVTQTGWYKCSFGFETKTSRPNNAERRI